MNRHDVLLIGTLPTHLGSKNRGGVARAVWELAQALRDARADFAVVGIGAYTGGDKTVDGVPIYGVRFNLWAALKTVRTVIQCHRAFRAKLTRDRLRLIYALYVLIYVSRRAQFRCLHVHHVTNQIPLAARLLRLDVRVVVTVHSVTEIVMARTVAERRRAVAQVTAQLAAADAVTWVSASLRQQARRFGVGCHCLEAVIFNGVALPSFNTTEPPRSHHASLVVNSAATPRSTRSVAPTQRSLPPLRPSLRSSDNRVCFVGELTEVKGVHRLLDAVTSLAATVDGVVWIGAGALERTIKRRLRAAGVRTTVCRQPDRVQVLREMAASSVLVVPSLSEGFGRVYVEALHSGTPVIGYHAVIEELAALLTPTETGWLTPYDHAAESAHDLARKLAVALEIKRRPTYQKARRTLRAAIQERLRWDRCAAQYMAAYRDAKLAMSDEL